MAVILWLAASHATAAHEAQGARSVVAAPPHSPKFGHLHFHVMAALDAPDILRPLHGLR